MKKKTRFYFVKKSDQFDIGVYQVTLACVAGSFIGVTRARVSEETARRSGEATRSQGVTRARVSEETARRSGEATRSLGVTRARVSEKAARTSGEAARGLGKRLIFFAFLLSRPLPASPLVFAASWLTRSRLKPNKPLPRQAR